MDIISDVKSAVFFLDEKYKYAQKKLRSAPPGAIQILKDPDYLRVSWVYYEDGHKIRKGIKGNKALVISLMRKAYYKEYASRLKQNLNVLKSILNKLVPMDFDSIMKEMPVNTNLLEEEQEILWVPSMMNPDFSQSVPIRMYTGYVPEDEREGWTTRKYRANTSHPEHLQHRTAEGFYMRSKGEMGLFDIYKRHRYATHYDEVLMFGDTIKSPDFVSMRPDGKLIIHEHCGAVNDPNYLLQHKKKLELYESCGIVPWDNLIVTYETADGHIDLKLAEAEICAKLEW